MKPSKVNLWLERVRKLKPRPGPTKINLRVVPPRSVSNAQPDERGSLDQEKETDGVLAILCAVAVKITGELDTIARKYEVIGKGESFPTQWDKKLREKIVMGMFAWAVRKMGSDLKAYLEEGSLNFLDHFRFNLDPYRTEFIPNYNSLFWSSFEKTLFLIPPKAERRKVHHSKLVEAFVRYKEIDWRIKTIPLPTRKDRLSYLCALKEKLPGVRDPLLRKWVDQAKKPSDIAAAYVCRDLKLGIGAQALKEYLKAFHRYDGYRHLVVANLKKMFEKNN